MSHTPKKTMDRKVQKAFDRHQYDTLRLIELAFQSHHLEVNENELYRARVRNARMMQKAMNHPEESEIVTKMTQGESMALEMLADMQKTKIILMRQSGRDLEANDLEVEPFPLPRLVGSIKETVSEALHSTKQ